MQHLISALGLLAFVGLAWLLSKNRKAIDWRLVGIGLSLQFLLGVLFLFLNWGAGKSFLYSFSEGVKEFLGLSMAGATFLFGPLADFGTVKQGLGIESGFLCAFQVLPTILFFSSFLSLLYHYGIMQRIVAALAWVMVRLLRTSGAESLSVSGNIFVGQTEAPLLIRPFLPGMTMSELFTVMVGGFATIAGGVFAMYVGMLEAGGFEGSAGHLVVASVMSAPAALVIAKILWPETEESETLGKVQVDVEKTASNGVEAAANGALDGLRLAVNVGAMLVAFLSLMALVNWVLAGFQSPEEILAAKEAAQAAGREWSDPLSLEGILGVLFSPLAFLLGVDSADVQQVGTLLGSKLAVTEFVAYQQLSGMVEQGSISDRSAMISTYALCGFANIGSVAIQIGGISALVPQRKPDLAKMGLLAMLGGAFASWMTACVVGILQ